MKIIKINGKDYVLKFTSEVISQLNTKGITFLTLATDMEKMYVSNLYETFFYGLKTMQHDITLEKAYKIIDEYYEENEDNDTESFFEIVLGEYSKAMGLGKKFKEIMGQQQKEVQLKKE